MIRDGGAENAGVEISGVGLNEIALRHVRWGKSTVLC